MPLTHEPAPNPFGFGVVAPGGVSTDARECIDPAEYARRAEHFVLTLPPTVRTAPLRRTPLQRVVHRCSVSYTVAACCTMDDSATRFPAEHFTSCALTPTVRTAIMAHACNMLHAARCILCAEAHCMCYVAQLYAESTGACPSPTRRAAAGRARARACRAQVAQPCAACLVGLACVGRAHRHCTPCLALPACPLFHRSAAVSYNAITAALSRSSCPSRCFAVCCSGQAVPSLNS